MIYIFNHCNYVPNQYFSKKKKMFYCITEKRWVSQGSEIICAKVSIWHYTIVNTKLPQITEGLQWTRKAFTHQPFHISPPQLRIKLVPSVHHNALHPATANSLQNAPLVTHNISVFLGLPIRTAPCWSRSMAFRQRKPLLHLPSGPVGNFTYTTP